MKPHSSLLDSDRFDAIRMTLQDDKDFEGAVEMLFEDFPEATRDEIVDVALDIERVGAE